MVRLKELERAYFTRKAGGAEPTKPLNQIKRDYIVDFIGGIGKSTGMGEIESLWLKKVVADDGQTPATYSSALWKQAVISVGEVPTDNLNDNKIKFFVSAP
jgi:hypothetical protein